jgi:CBS domain-containing protein
MSFGKPDLETAPFRNARHTQTVLLGNANQEGIMQVREIMTKKVRLTSPEDSIRDAAQIMRDDDIGSLPVASGDRLVGYVTDRDIVIRALADGGGPDTKVQEVMTDRILYCFEDDDVQDVAANMAENQVRRLPVLTQDKRLCGIVALADIATRGDEESAEDALEEISESSSR